MSDEKPKARPSKRKSNMGSADEHIRVSETVKRELDRQRGEDESYEDVLKRLLADERDFRAGFGVWSDELADRVRKARKQRKRKAKQRMSRLNE